MYKAIILVITSSVLASCSVLSQRSYDSGYSNDRSPLPYNDSDELKDYDHSLIELGMRSVQGLTPVQKLKLQQRLQVKNLERNLASANSKEQYYELKSYFKNDPERLKFLKMNDISEKERWLHSNGIKNRKSNFSPAVSKAISENDIIQYMPMTAVVDSWGEPDSKEHSGNEIYGNQRWVYNHFTSTPDGYTKEQRILFFENGRLKAWKTLRR